MRHAHVGWVRRNAVLAGSENGEHAVVPVIAGQPLPGSRLLQRHGRVAEVDAPRALQQVSGRRRHVAKLGRCACQNRLRQN